MTRDWFFSRFASVAVREGLVDCPSVITTTTFEAFARSP